MPIFLEPVTAPPGVEFRSAPGRTGRLGAIFVPRDGIPALTAYLMSRFALLTPGEAEPKNEAGPEAGPGHLATLTAAVQAMIDRREIQPHHIGPHHHVATYCDRAGTPYEIRWFDGQVWHRKGRTEPLSRTVAPNGFLRVVTIRRTDDGETALSESLTDPAVPYPDDLNTHYDFDVTLPPGAEDRLGVTLPELFARGDLGPHLPPGAMRELIEQRCAAAGVRTRRWGHDRSPVIARDGTRRLRVAFRGRPWVPGLHFTESWHTEKDNLGDPKSEYDVSVPSADLPHLAAKLSDRLGLAPVPGWLDDQLLACFTAMVTGGHLPADLPRQGARRVVAEWITDAGLTPTLRGTQRVESLFREHRANTDCVYELTVTIDPQARPGIRFREKYGYLPKPGDPGREYAYTAATGYASLPALIAHLGPGDPEDRLVEAFRTVIADGGGELREARDRVAAWFTAAGVPVEKDESSWFNSD